MRHGDKRGTRLAACLAAVVTAGAPACVPIEEQEVCVVGAASSLRELLLETRAAFERAHPGPPLRFSFAGSSTLARQLEAGAEIDVFLSADESSVAHLAGRFERPAGGPACFLTNHLALVARDDVDPGVANPQQLARWLGDGDRRLALAAASVPAGRYARDYLGEVGLLEVLEPHWVLADSVRTALAQVESGAAPFGFVYATDAALAEGCELRWREERARACYVAAVRTDARTSARTRAEAYVHWLRGEAFQAAARRHGFGDARP